MIRKLLVWRRALATALLAATLLGVGCSSEPAPQGEGDQQPQSRPADEKKPDNPEAVAAYDKGVAAEAQGDYAAAREQYIQARVHQPNFRDTEERLDALGVILTAKLGYEEAEKTGDASQQASAAISFANALRDRPAKARDLHKSRVLLEEASQKNPSDAEAHYLLSVVAAERGDLGAALEHATKALELNPDHAGAHYQVAFVNRVMEGGDAAQALEHAQKAVEKAAEPQAHYYELVAVCDYDAGKTEEAVAAITKAAELSDKPRYKERLNKWKPPEPPPADAPPADAPPADAPPADAPPADAPPADTPPADTPPADTPPADKPADMPPADTPPADTPPADKPADPPPADRPPADKPADPPPADKPEDAPPPPPADEPKKTGEPGLPGMDD
ncbi:MAG: tetratricopeptide repeat protein [Planctomycetota bacterium]